MPDWATRVVASVHVRDDEGTTHVFGPDDDVIPAWARAKITNPAAWGQVAAPRQPGPVLDYGSDVATDDWALGRIDVVCGGDGQGDSHPRDLIARFEAVIAAAERTTASGETAWWDWVWAGSLAMTRDYDSAGYQEAPFAMVAPDRQTVVELPDGRVTVQLRCRRHRRALNLPLTWEHTVDLLDGLRELGVPSVQLPALVATITRK